jgi:hypothetical protein
MIRNFLNPSDRRTAPTKNAIEQIGQFLRWLINPGKPQQFSRLFDHLLTLERTNNRFEECP